MAGVCTNWTGDTFCLSLQQILTVSLSVGQQTSVGCVENSKITVCFSIKKKKVLELLFTLTGLIPIVRYIITGTGLHRFVISVLFHGHFTILQWVNCGKIMSISCVQGPYAHFYQRGR